MGIKISKQSIDATQRKRMHHQPIKTKTLDNDLDAHTHTFPSYLDTIH